MNIKKENLENLLGFKLLDFKIKREKENGNIDIYLIPENLPKHLILNFNVTKEKKG